MNRAEILKKINEIFRDVFDDATLVITEKTYSDDIEDWDSLAQITLITTVEDAFDMHFTLEEAAALKDVGDMLSIIEREVNER